MNVFSIYLQFCKYEIAFGHLFAWLLLIMMTRKSTSKRPSQPAAASKVTKMIVYSRTRYKSKRFNSIPSISIYDDTSVFDLFLNSIHGWAADEHWYHQGELWLHYFFRLNKKTVTTSNLSQHIELVLVSGYKVQISNRAFQMNYLMTIPFAWTPLPNQNFNDSVLHVANRTLVRVSFSLI